MKGKKTGGRKKGVTNRLTSDVRDMVLSALDKAGGTEYLCAQAMDNPGPFMALVARCLPKEIKAELTAEMVVRQEVRRDLIDQLVSYVNAGTPQLLDSDLPALPVTPPRPESHTPDSKTH